MTATELHSRGARSPRSRRAITVALVAVSLVTALMTVPRPVSAERAGTRPEAARPSCSTTYTVVGGDSWYGISRKVGASVNGLLDANRATTATPLMVGAVVCLPAGIATTVPATTMSATTAPATTAPATTRSAPATTSARPTGSCGVAYTVVRGDSWYGISRRVGVSMNALLDANGATVATPLLVGTVICLPQSASTTPGTTTPPATVAPTTVPPTTVPPSATTPLPVQLAAFPVQGPCWFGDTWLAPRGGGRLHEGADVIARAGLYVYAVQDGTLTRRVLDRPGLLSGNAWWLTARDGTYFFYAHLSAFAPGLEVGSKVKAGQVIGFIGRTGSASGNHLHFEIHPRGGRAINPAPILRAVDGCQLTTPLPQPPGVALPAPPTTVPPSTAPSAGGPTSPPSGEPALTPSAPTAPAAPSVAPTSPSGPALWQFSAPRSMGTVTLPASRPSAVRVAGVSGVSSSVTGVIVRLTASSSSAGFLVTYPCDTAPPSVSTLTLRPGVTAVGSTLVEVAGGSMCVMSNVAVQLTTEVLAVRSSSGVGMQPVAATRVLDTRTTTRLGPGVTAEIPRAALGALGAGGGTQAATVSVTVVGPAGAGTLSMGFCGQGLWKSPVTGDGVSSFAMTMRLSASGWCLTSSVAMDVIVDVVGLWGSSRAVTSVDPVRVFDSRSGGGPVGQGGRTVAIAGVGGVAGSASAALVSVTVVTGGIGTSVFVVPCGQPRSSGTVVAASANRVTSAVVPIGLGGGAICISSIHPADVIVDVVGAG